MPLTIRRRTRHHAKRVRAAQVRADRIREADRRARGALVRRPPWDELPDWPDDGSAGVREPRRPLPQAPTGAIALDLPDTTGTTGSD